MRVLLIAAMCVLAAGCRDDRTDLEREVAKQEACTKLGGRPVWGGQWVGIVCCGTMGERQERHFCGATDASKR